MSYSISTPPNILLVPRNKWCDCFFAKGTGNSLNVNLDETFALEQTDGTKISGIYFLSKSKEGKVKLNKNIAEADVNESKNNTTIYSSGSEFIKSKAGEDYYNISICDYSINSINIYKILVEKASQSGGK